VELLLQAAARNAKAAARPMTVLAPRRPVRIPHRPFPDGPGLPAEDRLAKRYGRVGMAARTPTKHSSESPRTLDRSRTIGAVRSTASRKISTRRG
jgi:hypothetical protein